VNSTVRPASASKAIEGSWSFDIDYKSTVRIDFFERVESRIVKWS